MNLSYLIIKVLVNDSKLILILIQPHGVLLIAITIFSRMQHYSATICEEAPFFIFFILRVLQSIFRKFEFKFEASKPQLAKEELLEYNRQFKKEF